MNLPTSTPASAQTLPLDDTPPRWERYVAIGDSFTEGLWDVDPADPERVRGWADRLALDLSARRVAAGSAPLQYANLAVRGKKLVPIVDEQVPAALALRPDLVSLVAGGNDILRPHTDVDALAAHLEDAVVRLRATGADVLLATGFDSADSPLVAMTRPRVGVFNAHLWSIARRHGAHVLDLWGMRALHDWRVWSSDRIHLNDDGHRRVADAAMVALGQRPTDAGWDVPLDVLPPAPFSERARENARWAREFVGPWVGRRVRGRSSGDGRAAKYPTFTEQAAAVEQEDDTAVRRPAD
ncbi:SGNH/GDSL hydrolase family protein [Luteimicrobium subarcticum]|uniref:Lysophospholipase L1-like esterase n=1 Tax=Luteimicrobium subarcticum TaxID=620910 RepID=A0A2M8WSQ9_9MICO|nr:SGNH/GDSL hydrolase family protein [Luteimicrobium subarcticum]PJI93985.1 lysophospholipase L1-like esterase [Luteimicrobium subarcticum]